MFICLYSSYVCVGEVRYGTRLDSVGQDGDGQGIAGVLEYLGQREFLVNVPGTGGGVGLYYLKYFVCGLEDPGHKGWG